MSDYNAIGAVSSTLRSLLTDRMELPAGLHPPLSITVATPRADTQSPPATDPPRINLFLYRVAENGNLKNQEIPGHGHGGSYGKPPLSLDLYFLMTAYGSTPAPDGTFVNEMLAQELLGSAMRVFHEVSVISEDVKDESNKSILDDSLRGEFERVKITLDPLGLEDLSKVWTALTLPFRLSAAYKVTVVQIASRLTGRRGLPVKTRRVHMATARLPAITTLYRTPGAKDFAGDMRLRLGDEITIGGRAFKAKKTYVRMGTLEPIRVEPADDETIHIAVPDDKYPIDGDHAAKRDISPEDLLQAGPQVVEVLTVLETEAVEGGLGTGEFVEDQRTLRSNQAVFMLVPRITSIDPVEGRASDTSLTVKGTRLFRKGLQTAVVVGDASLNVTGSGQTDTAIVASLAPLADALPKPPAGGQPYRVRVVVNGAESTEEAFTFTLKP